MTITTTKLTTTMILRAMPLRCLYRALQVSGNLVWREWPNIFFFVCMGLPVSVRVSCG